MTIEERLTELLEDEYPQTVSIISEAWSIATDDDAAWASRKIATAQAEIDRINAWADREHKRIDDIVEREVRGPLNTIDFMKAHLHSWFNKLLANGRRTKSIDLPGGRFSVRTIPSQAKVDDQTQFLAWAKQNAPELVRVKETVDLTELKKRFEVDGQYVIDTLTGEFVPHVIVEPERENASFKVEEMK